MTRSVRILIAGLALALALVAVPAGAQTPPSPTTTAFDLSDCTGAITKPGCGEAPEASGDRGGAAQLGLFLLIAAVTAGGLGYVAMRVRRGTQARAEAVTGDWS